MATKEEKAAEAAAVAALAEAKAAEAKAAKEAEAAEAVAEGLIRMTKDGEESFVNETCVDAHKSVGWVRSAS